MLGQVGLAELGPNLMRQSERMLALFQAAGFAPGEADQALNTLIAYVVGMTTSEAAYLSMIARSGQTEQEWAENLRPTAEEAMQDHPRLRDGYVARRDADPRQLREEPSPTASTAYSTVWRPDSTPRPAPPDEARGSTQQPMN